MTEKPEKPLDQSPAGVVTAALLVSIYGVGALALVAISIYFAVVQKLPFTSPKVFVGLLGALYLGVRGYMMFNKRSRKNGHAG